MRPSRTSFAVKSRVGWQAVPETQPFPGLVLGMARFYHDPRGSMRGLLASAPSDGRLFGYLLIAMAIVLAGKLARLGAETPPGDDFMGQATAQAAAWLFMLPLIYIGLAAVGTLIARAFGGTGTFQNGRAAFFWAWLVASPLIALSAIAPLALRDAPDWTAALAVQVGPVFFIWALAQCYAEAFGFRRSWTVFASVCAPILILFVVFRFAD